MKCICKDGDPMDYLSVRDFRTSPKEARGNLEENDKVVITNNGKPTALMVEVDGASQEETPAALGQAAVMRAVNRMRTPSMRTDMPDADDRMFYEVAKPCGAVLIMDNAQPFS